LPIKNQRTIKIDSGLHKELKIYAAIKETTVFKLINQAVKEWLERENDKRSDQSAHS
jgi:predicted transcriptional regulator